MKSSSRSRSKQAVTYMEVYGTNRVLYRVTASNTHRNQKLSVVYGIFLQDLRSGETAEIHAFSNSLEKTVCFVNDLIQKPIKFITLLSGNSALKFPSCKMVQFLVLNHTTMKK